ncbi:MAG: Spy/CpxP family protein refolding chaperone [Cyanosarcina radialis HA8281-LM2]|jgi:Spy/CpxP family protein refolding chaperone|nr:Spy/CpxP family protein refolding chaperone [Cyanosarcina radialis HA8281-LM2]
MGLRRFSLLAVTILSLGSAAVITNPTGLSAQAQPDFPLAQRGDRNRLVQELNLSQDQVNRLEAIRQQYQSRISQQKQALSQAQQELRTLMAGTSSASDIRNKYNQVKGLRQQLADTRFESMLAMREVLNPQQRQRFVELMQNRRGKFRNRAPRGNG